MKFPNAENLASKFCRTDPVVTATALADRTYTELPANLDTWPVCRITRVGGAPDGGARPHADRPLLQFEVWGGPKTVAHDIAATIREQLAARSPWRGLGGTLAVSRWGGLRYIPDVSYDPARPRYLFDVEIIVRP
jgi:hypothetical protein